MARSWNTIYNQVVSSLQAKSVFNGLQPSAENADSFINTVKSTSKVSVWRSICFIVSVYHWLQELLYDDHIAEVEQKYKETQIGTAPWWERKLKEYQHGYQLSVLNGAIVYNQIDVSATIVSVAAAKRVGNAVKLKVAKGESPNLSPLSFDEEAGIASYCSQIAPVGENIILVNKQPDELKVQADIYYSALSGLSTVKANVESAINNYLAELKFAGVFKINTLIDKIQEVEGVIDVQITLLEGKISGGSFIPIVRTYESEAGYMKVSAAHPLSSNLNYVSS